MMKKIALTIALAIGVFAFSAVFAFAQTAPAVTVSGGEGTSPVTYSYSQDSQMTYTKSIKELLSGLSNLESGSITQSITVSSESDAPVKFWLRISEKEAEKSDALPQAAESTPAPGADSVLDYYSVKITTSEGEEVYDSSTGGKTSPYDTYKDMELLTLNGEETSDSEEYVIEISTNDSLSALSADAAKLEWLIVSDGYSASAAGASDAADTSDAGASDTVTLSAGAYTVGEDIDAGKYIVTGDSTVKVYTAEDDLKTNIILTADKDSKTGVEEYTLNLSDGERVEVTSDTVFAPYTAAPPSPAAAAAMAYAEEANDKTVGEPGAALAITALALAGAAAATAAVVIRKKNVK